MDLSNEYLGTHHGFDLVNTYRKDGPLAVQETVAERGRISISAETEAAARDEVERLTSPKVMRDVQRLN